MKFFASAVMVAAALMLSGSGYAEGACSTADASKKGGCCQVACSNGENVAMAKGGAAKDNSVQGYQLGQKVPNFTLSDASGKQYSLSDYSGKVVALVFYNQACPYVVEAKGRMDAFQKAYAEKGVQVLAIDAGVSNSTENIAAEAKTVSFPILVNNTSDLAVNLGATKTPEVFVLNKEGVVVYQGAFDNGQKAIEMKVIVGQEFEGRSTPVFSDSMETVVFRPYWLVTPTIQAKELEPKIAADPGYLSRGNYEYYSEGGKQRIRQKPGEKNSLGLVKFLFPNDFNIYLHDTPQDELFEKDVRAFSHGCIRLEKPAEFAQWVLGWDAARVQQAMNSGPDDKGVRLPRKLPVYIAYFTAYQRDGRLHWGNDVYDRDATLAQAVAQGAVPSAQAVRAIDGLRKLVDD